MPDHEKEKLLREIEKGLEHSRKIIAQIDKVLTERSRLLLIAKSQWLRPGGSGKLQSSSASRFTAAGKARALAAAPAATRSPRR
jgi:hypothetical protein